MLSDTASHSGFEEVEEAQDAPAAEVSCSSCSCYAWDVINQSLQYFVAPLVTGES